MKNVSSPLLLGLVTAVLLVGCGKSAPPAPAAGSAPTTSGLPKLVADASVTRAQIESGALEPTCSVESVAELAAGTPQPAKDGMYTVPRDKAVKFIGFATIKGKGEAMGAFTAHLASVTAVYKVDGVTNLERPDVVDYFKAPGMLKSGFHLDVDLKDLPPGDYGVFLKSASGSWCPTHHTLRIQ